MFKYVVLGILILCAACSEDGSSPPGEEQPIIDPCDLKDAVKVGVTVVEMSFLTQHEYLAGYYDGPNVPKKVGNVFNEDVRNSALWLVKPPHFYYQETCDIQTCWDVTWASGEGKSWENNTSMPYFAELYSNNVTFREACNDRGMYGLYPNETMESLQWDDGLMLMFLNQLDESHVEMGRDKYYEDELPYLIVHDTSFMDPAADISILGVSNENVNLTIINSSAIEYLVEHGNGETPFSYYLEKMVAPSWLRLDGLEVNKKHFFEYYVRIHELGHWWSDPVNENGYDTGEHHQWVCDDGPWHDNDIILGACTMVDIGWLSASENLSIGIGGYCSCCWQAMAETNILR